MTTAAKRRKRGGGSVCKPHTSRFWHLAYHLDGERHREETKVETEAFPFAT